jgi:hypothetical protein
MKLTEEDAKKIARSIGFGHAYEKHAANVSESGELLTRSSFESLVLETLLNPAKSKGMKRGRSAFWNSEEGFVVVFDPKDPDLGTAFWPTAGVNEYKELH